MSQSYDTILSQIDAFIRKHYMNKLLHGSIIAVLIFLLAWLVVASLEYMGHYSVQIRTWMFYILIVAYLAVFFNFILRPLLWFFGFGKRLSRKQAALLIAENLPEIRDTLFNLLELKELSVAQSDATDLIEASIRQRSESLKPFHFPSAVNFKQNRKTLRWLSLPGIILLVIFVVNPGILTEGSQRVINYNTPYEKPAPFSFVLLTDTLEVTKGEDFKLSLSVEGNLIPDQVRILFAGSEKFMVNEGNGLFSYLFRNVNQDFFFQFRALDIESAQFKLSVQAVPLIYSLKIYAKVPAYTGLPDVVLENTGNLSVPAGTEVTWSLSADYLKKLGMIRTSDTLDFIDKGSKEWELKRTLFQSGSYSIIAQDLKDQFRSLLNYNLTVLPDNFPGIDLEMKIDSSKPFLHFFKGEISDDYGFTNLRMVVLKDNLVDSTIILPFVPSILTQNFYAGFDFSVYSGDDPINFYFEVFDNDQVNGYKSSKTAEFSFMPMSEKALEEFSDQSSEEIMDLLKESDRLTNELLKDLKNLKEKSLNETLTEWEQSQKLDQIHQKEQQLQEMIDKMKDLNQLKNEMENTFNAPDQEMLQKQMELEKLMDELFDQELKDLLDQLKDLQQNMDPKMMKELTKEMDLSMQDLKDQLDRNLELLKKYEIEKDLEKAIQELDKLSQDQQKLSDDIDKKGLNEESLQKQQEQQEKFEELKQEYQDNLKKNEELKRPMPLEDMKEELNSISESFQKDKQSMQSGDRKDAQKGTSKNSKQLKKASESLSAMKKKMQKKEKGENIEDLKQIVDNLIRFSFDQEDLFLQAQQLGSEDPKANKIIITQNKLKKDFELIRDSLQALSLREPRAGSIINKELGEINRKFITLSEYDENPNMQLYAREQQFVMTGANNLALLLSELIKQMQQEMNNMGSPKEGDDCENPNSQGKPGMEGMKEMQEGLKQQLQQMIEQMKKGEGKPGQEGMNRQIAQMMAQQEIFRDMLSKMMNSDGISSETQKILQEINKLSDELERDLVNKRITPDLLNRQQKILTRLLEAEKSANKREFEQKRESRENTNPNTANPEDFFKQGKPRMDLREIIEYQDIKLNNYYNLKYREYLRRTRE